MQTIYISHTGPTPLGDIWVAVSENGLVAVEFPSDEAKFREQLEKRYRASSRALSRVAVEFSTEKAAEAVDQLKAYASGQLREFTIPIDWSVLNNFQHKALKATFDIPYGETRTYGEIAAQIGSPRAARAVGRAQATNPMPIVLPCHRVLGSDKKLHGYGAGDGLSTKTWLLEMEKRAK
jgi:methylated-DNA-[protein]-cysteine S-methyltransferase